MFSAHLLTTSALLLSLTALSACSPSSSKDTSEPANCELTGQSYGIVGGDILSSGNDLSSSTVLIAHLSPSSDASICTGTLIAEDKVLTAAHCISSYGGQTKIAFTNNVDCATKAQVRTLREVTNTVAHSKYSYSSKDIENANYDLAILKFKGGLAPGYKVRPLPQKSFSLVAGDILVMSGYGVTTEDGEDSGKLRFTTATQDRMMKQVYINSREKTLTPKSSLIVDQPNNGVCSGDSGGALYVKTDSGLTLLGVTSMVVDYKAKYSFEVRFCHGAALFTDVREHLDWIQRQMKYLN